MTVKGPYGFRGGLNLKSSSINLPPDQMTDAQNVYIVYNDLVKANGSVKVNTAALVSTSPGGVAGMFQWKFNAANSYLFTESIGASAESFKYITNLGTTSTAITDDVGITDTNPHYALLNSILVRVGGNATTVKWTGPGNHIVALGGSPPTGTVCTVANNFLFIAGNSSNPSRVYWSNVADPETWPATSVVDFRANDGDKIVGLTSYNQNLLIWKQNSIGQLYTYSTVISGSSTLAPLVTLTVGRGLCSRLAWDYVNQLNICFVATNNHVYIFDGANFLDISDPPYPGSNIQPYLDTIKIAQTNPIVVNYPTRSQIWISTTDGTSSLGATAKNIILIYNYSLGIWESKITGRNPQSMIAYTSFPGANGTTTDGGTLPVTMLTGSHATFVYQQDVGSSNAEDTNGVIDGYGVTSVEVAQDSGEFPVKSFLVPTDAQGSWFLQVNYGFNATNIVNKSANVSLAIPGGLLDSFILDSSTLGGNTLLRKTVIPFSNNNVASVQIQFRNQNSGQGFIVHPYYISDQIIS
jgi:hypothetical protein